MATSTVDRLIEVLGGMADVLAGAGPVGYGVAGPAPEATVRPHDEAAVVALVRLARAEGWALVPRGAGTQDRWGSPLERAVVVLDTTILRGIVAHAPGDLTARVLPGTPLGWLNAELRGHRQALMLDPAGQAVATVGGIVAGDAWGPGRQAYGTARDQVIGLRVVDGRGQTFATGGHVVKNVSGLDIGKLLIGSFGTLGVLTEVAVKLRPLPPAATFWGAVFAESAAAWEAIAAIAGSTFAPSGAVLWPDGAGRAVLAVRLEGSPTDIQDQRGRLGRLCRGAGPLGPEEASRAFAAGQAIAESRAQRPALVRCDVPEGALPGLMALAVALAGCGVVAWPGTGTLWCSFEGAEGPALLAQLTELRAAAEAAGGRALITDAAEAVRVALPPFGDPGPLLPLLAACKGRFDPDGVLAPGRMGFGAAVGVR